ncbi:MAG: P-loop domain-containing protein [Clostridium sp.]
MNQRPWQACRGSILSVRIKTSELVSFVADGAILPRKHIQPAHENSTFLPLNHADHTYSSSSRKLPGMAVRRGITLIVGGGIWKIHPVKGAGGRVYDHIAGDGVICDHR